MPAVMIRLKCKSCATVLELDDAFAGGTCRCSHCGAIQSVPKPATPAGAVPMPSPKPVPQPTVRVGKPAARPSSGLEELAEVVTSSGLTGQSVFTPPPGRAERRRKLLVVGGSVLAALLIVVVLAIAFLRGQAPSTSDDGGGGISTGTATGGAGGSAASSGPTFADIPLSGRTVAYVLDRGDASREYFGLLKELTLRSVASLGSERRFLVVFWDNGESIEEVPTRPLSATTENLNALRVAMDRVIALGRSRFAPAMTAAMAIEPDDVVIATAKGWQLDESFVSEAMRLRGPSKARVHAIALGGGTGGLKDVADRTGGQFRELPLKQLRDLLK